MKKFLALFTGVLAVCGLSANPMGNPADPVIYEDGISMTGKSDMSYRLGYVGDFVMDRKLRIKHQNNSKTEIAEKDFNGAELTLNMYDRFDVFGRVGYSSYNTRWLTPDIAVGTVGTTARVATRSDFAWALGAKGVLYQWDNTTVTVNGSYAQGNAKLDRAETTGTTPGFVAHVASQNVKQRERKWNLGASLGYQIENMSPYVGLQYIKDKSSFNNNHVMIGTNNVMLMRKENRKKIGGVLGLGMTSGKKASFNIEGRFLGEIALALTGQARF